MKKILNKTINILFILQLAIGFNTSFIFAEEIPISSEISNDTQIENPQNQETSVVSGEIILDSNENGVEQATDNTVIQDTVSVQDGLSVDEIGNTPSDIEIVPVFEDSDVDSKEDGLSDIADESIAGELSEDLDINEEPEEIVEEQANMEEIIEDDFVVEISKPRPIYTFSLTKRTIPTHRKDLVKEKRLAGKQTLSPSDKVIDSVVEETIIPDINDEEGTMHLSGQCLDKYFVVLLYKNESDYSDNANSYIYNKAFLCDGGNFEYEISQLPESLSEGTYYILIGEQGDVGSWKPASQLTEININRN